MRIVESRAGEEFWFCDHCQRRNPIALTACEGCGSVTMAQDEPEPEIRMNWKRKFVLPNADIATINKTSW